MAETEKRLGEQFTQLEAQDIKLEQSISDTRESILLKANRMDLESAEKKLGRQLGQLDEKLAVVDQSVAEAKQELSKAMREDLAEMANRTNLALDVVGAKWEEFNVVIEDIKTRISETDSALRNRIKEQAQSTDVLIGEQTVSLEGLIASIKGQLAEQIDKLDGFPAQLQAQKQYFEDFKRSVLGELHEHAQQTQRSVSEVKDSSRFKASISDLDRLQATIQSEVQKLKTQMDVDLMTHDQKLQRLQDQDSSIKERLREFAAGRERDNQEFQTRSRQMHESATKRIDSLELHVAEYPKLIESLVSDIRLIRSDLDDRVQKELVRVEQQVALLKGRLQDCISEQAVQQTIQTYLSPVNSQLQRTGETIMDLRGTMDKKWDILSSVNAQTAQNSMRINTLVDRLSSQSSSGPSPIEPPGAVPFASSSVRSSTGSLVKGSFYKPAHLSFKDEPADRARGPSSDEADGGAESTGDDLTDLEKLADMATNGGFQLPAVPRRSPDGGEHEY
ncbi:uncharacterized protein BJ171DRAFT_493977 [Polychytrium aggregatum]|uniref:uncharacterized protein n=1 Tax=Polychytrium aggregatum TaxID=110093 RepID=UPI0022FE04AF|nr:uncharacterized protein BJ171DRAFT_493977 [Polychytrium aggregatum]KAI9207240.1 hypothetical protein BJ171DRAFT_493977 [Polychytrium aggregatum]